MSFWDVIAEFRAIVRRESRRISACITTICLIVFVGIVSILSIRDIPSSTAMIIITIIVSIIATTFLFVTAWLLLVSARDYGMNRRILRNLIDSPSDDPEESLFCRYYLSVVAGLILSTMTDPQSYTLHPDSANCHISHELSRRPTALSLWSFLSDNYPDIHALTLNSTKERKSYVIHIDSDRSFTLTTLYHLDNQRQCMEYLPVTIVIYDDFVRATLDALSIIDIAHYDETDIVVWDNPSSVKKFYDLALPEHDFPIH